MSSNERRFLSALDVVEITGLSKSASYILIKQLNTELEKKGFLTVRGKVINTYFYERFFGKEVDNRASLQRQK